MKAQLAMGIVTARLASMRRMRVRVGAFPDHPDEVTLAQEFALHAEAVPVRPGHQARDGPSRKIDRPVQRVEALEIRPDDLRVGPREPQVHRRSTSAERIARATCLLDCRSTCGSDGIGLCTAIDTRTSRAAWPTCSIRPPLDGTNSSGPRSPTR